MRFPSLLVLFVAALCAGAAAQQTTAPPAAGAAASAPQLKTWFIRLIPPRPTFAEDMNDVEKKTMQDHYQYWKEKFEKGICVFGGPVLDPAGVYGVLVVQAATKEEANALASGDPSVAAGINRVEVAEMVPTFLHKGK